MANKCTLSIQKFMAHILSHRLTAGVTLPLSGTYTHSVYSSNEKEKKSIYTVYTVLERINGFENGQNNFMK